MAGDEEKSDLITPLWAIRTSGNKLLGLACKAFMIKFLLNLNFHHCLHPIQTQDVASSPQVCARYQQWLLISLPFPLFLIW